MFNAFQRKGGSAAKNIYKSVPRGWLSHCDDNDSTEADLDDDQKPSIIEQADAEIERSKSAVRTPMQFDNIKIGLQQVQASTYDGCRVMVQKNVNLNTVATHFYWIGSQAMPAPLYQYRLILPMEEDKGVVMCSTDMDFNIEAEAKYSLAKNVMCKCNFASQEQGVTLTTDLELTDDSSAVQFQYSPLDNYLMMSYMQSITPQLSLGGMGKYSIKPKQLETAFGGVFDDTENIVMAQWDSNLKVMYMRKVNPDRVHLMTDLTIDEGWKSTMGVGAEIFLKQSKLHMSVDSDAVIKSTLEANVQKQMTLQFSAEMQHMKQHYRFGFGIVLMA